MSLMFTPSSPMGKLAMHSFQIYVVNVYYIYPAEIIYIEICHYGSSQRICAAPNSLLGKPLILKNDEFFCQGCMDVRVFCTVVSVSQKITNILRVHQKKRIQKITVQAAMAAMTSMT